MDLYPFDVLFSVGDTDEELREYLERFEFDIDDYFDKATSRGNFFINSSNQSIVRFKDAKPSYGTIAHEIFHAVTIIFDRIGMKFLPLQSDEAYAYAIEHLTDKFYRKFLD